MNMQLTADGIFVGVIGTLLTIAIATFIAAFATTTQEHNIQKGSVLEVDGHAYICKELKP